MELSRVAGALLAVAVVASCQELIALGDEPTLGCGVARAPGPRCRDCLDTKCCEKSVACLHDAECKANAEGCLALCFSDECYLSCIAAAQGNPVYDAYFTCAADCAEQCTPSGDCETLGSCCETLTEQTLRDSCARVARGEDQANCRASLEILTQCEGAGGAPSE